MKQERARALSAFMGHIKIALGWIPTTQQKHNLDDSPKKTRVHTEEEAGLEL